MQAVLPCHGSQPGNLISKPVPFAPALQATVFRALASCKTPVQNEPVKIGYARVSTDDQSLALQRDALTQAGCATICEDAGVSGSIERRPGLDQALALLGQGDVLVTWRLDRLGRSLPHLIALVASLADRGCGFLSLSENIDTTSAGGKLVFHIMGALAEFERALIVERTRAGVAAARKRGQHLGRRRSLRPDQVQLASDTIAGGTQSTSSMAQLLGVSKTTLWRALKAAEASDR